MIALRALILSMLVLCAVKANAQPLITAARNGDTSALEALLKDGADPNVEGPIGTALHIVSLKGDASAAALLVAAGAEVNVWNDRLGTPLLASLSAGGIYGKTSLDRSEIVSLLIDAGADLDAQTAKGMSALHFAVVSGDEASVEALLQAGADVDAVAMPLDQHNKSFKTGLGNGPTSALHIALWSGQATVAAKLRATGAAPKPVSEAPLTGDVERGRLAFEQKCAACHILREGEKELGGPVQGPPLGNLAGRPVASIEGYEYSDAMQEFSGEWDADRLYSFVLEPKLIVPGTHMTGLMPVDPDDAADIVAFLAVFEE